MSGEGLRPEDLEELAEVKVVGFRRTRRPDVRIFTVEYQGRKYTVGVVGEEAFQAVLGHGLKKAGEIWLRLPRSALRDEGTGWINAPY